MEEYEGQRLKRIEENKRKMKELGIKPIAYAAAQLMAPNKQKINKMKKDLSKDVEYLPEEEGPIQKSNDDQDNNKIVRITRILRSYRSKEVMADQVGGSVDKPQSISISMSTMIKMHSQECENKQQQGKGKWHQKNQIPALLGQIEDST